MRFFVGQRVRIINATRYPWVLNAQATITSELRLTQDPFTKRIWSGHYVNIDGFGAVAPDGFRYKGAPDQLEPLTDRNEKVSWSEVVWQPEHLRSNA